VKGEPSALAAQRRTTNLGRVADGRQLLLKGWLGLGRVVDGRHLFLEGW